MNADTFLGEWAAADTSEFSPNATTEGDIGVFRSISTRVGYIVNV